MNYELLLQLGVDIPFAEAQLEIHQPTIAEIGMVNESIVYNACFLINFKKEDLLEEDRIGLEDKTNFEIFMSIMCSKDNVKLKNEVLLLFTLLFPDYKIEIDTNKFKLIHFKTNKICCIDDKNYDTFKEIISQVFCLRTIKTSSQKYDPLDERARKIAEKLSKKKKKNEESKGTGSIFSYYISVLSIGLQKDKNSFRNYTAYQLIDEFNRFQAKLAYDGYTAAAMAGCQDLDEVDHWMKEHSFLI